MAKKNEDREVAAKELQTLQGRLRDGLLAEIQEMDPKAVGKATISLPSVADHFSDWHDHFGDGGHFGDGFGKAGGRVAEVTAAINAIKTHSVKK